MYCHPRKCRGRASHSRWPMRRGKGTKMALVNCRECGEQVSDSAATCPKCGVAAPAGMASLTFIRSGVGGRAIRIEVYVDQKPFGKVVGNPGLVVPVSPGTHHIELRTSSGKATTGTVQVTQGNTVFKVTLSGMTGSPKMQ